MSSVLSLEERARIEAAVRALESRSSIELVVAVVRRSGEYWPWRLAVAASWVLGLLLLALHVLGFDAYWVAVLELPLGAVLLQLLGLGVFTRLVTPRAALEREVRARAFRAFAEHGLSRTRDHTGLLLWISELERQVVILGDSGLHGRMGEAGWQEQIARLIERIRERQAGQGVVELIERIEARLASEFPVRSDDTNELPDDVISD